MMKYTKKMPALDDVSNSTRPEVKHIPFSGAERKKEFHANPIWIIDTSREWESMLHLGKYMTFKAKEYIPPQQDGQSGFYYLKYGKARVMHVGANNKEVTLYHLGEGTLIYDMASHDYSTHYSVFAITPVEAYFFPAAKFLTEEFAAEHPRLLLGLIRAQALKNMHYMRRIVNIAGGDAFSNTCKLMLELSHSYGNALEVPLGVTHEEIASLLCVRRSWLGKILRRLKDEGVITRCTKSRLIIADPKKLAAYAAE